MKEIFEAFVGIFFLLILSVASLSVIASSMDMNNANNYHKAIIVEIEESDFAESVIQSIGEKAKERDYTLEIELFNEDGTTRTLVFDKNNTPTVGDTKNTYLAEVNLTYNYTFAFINLVSPHTLIGYAK